MTTSLWGNSEKDFQNWLEAVDLQISPHNDEKIGPVSQLCLEKVGVLQSLCRTMDRARTDYDKDSDIMSSYDACCIVTS